MSRRSWFGIGLAAGAAVTLVTAYFVWGRDAPRPCPECGDQPVERPPAPPCDRGGAESPPPPVAEVPVACPPPPVCDGVCPSPPPPCEPPPSVGECGLPQRAAILPWDRHPADTLPAAIENLRRLAQQDPKNAEVANIIDGLVDAGALAEAALGGTGPDTAVTYWQRLDAGRRCTFLTLHRKLLRQIVTEELLGEGLLSRMAFEPEPHEQIRLGEVSVAGKDRRELRGHTMETSVIVRLRVVDGAWRITDLITDDVSMAQSFREDISRVLEDAATFDAGWEDLLDRLRKKVAEITR